MQLFQWPKIMNSLKKTKYKFNVINEIFLIDRMFGYLIDPSDLIRHVIETFLYCSYILYVLLHHVELTVIIELIHTSTQFLEF